MSHFTVVVCLNDKASMLARATRVGKDWGTPGEVLQGAVDTLLARALAPFDENAEAEPYRDYEEGGPANYWAVSTFREEYGLNPDDTTLTWAEVAEVHNRKWDDSPPMLIDEMGRAYTMSTYNPNSKWDWYQIGGRWAGYFPYHQEHAHHVINGEKSWANENEPLPPLHCDGGPKFALDLNKLREEKAHAARKEYEKYKAVTKGTPEALPWSTFTDNVSEENGYTIERAREEYNSQPRIQAFQNDRDFFWSNNENFSCGEKLYIERARARAVPGYSLLTLDGTWMAPGKMGWFGMSSDGEGDRIGYWEASNAYIEALPDDTYLVAVDCHI